MPGAVGSGGGATGDEGRVQTLAVRRIRGEGLTSNMVTAVDVACHSVTKLCPTLCDPRTAAHQASLSFTVSQSFLKVMSVEPVMPSNHLVLCCLFLLLPSVFPRIRVFSDELAPCIRWPKYWRLSFSIGPSNEYSGLISFRRDWLDLLAVQGSLKSLLQNHSSKASILWSSAFL